MVTRVVVCDGEHCDACGGMWWRVWWYVVACVVVFDGTCGGACGDVSSGL